MITEVPFILAGRLQPVILLPVHVNGDGPFPFILDTGAGACLLTPELAVRLQVKVTGSQQASGAGGQVVVQLGEVESLAVGSALVHDVPLAITPEIHRIADSVGAAIDGDLGYTFLSHFRMSIDYRKNVIRFENPGPLRASRGGTIPFTLAAPSKPLVLVDGLVNGRGPYRLALDTGTSTTVLSPGVARGLGVPLREGLPLTGGGGMIPTFAGVAGSIELGSARVDNVEFRAADFLQTLSQVTGARLDGIVGHNFLKHFCVTIDYSDSSLTLQ